MHQTLRLVAALVLGTSSVVIADPSRTLTMAVDAAIDHSAGLRAADARRRTASLAQREIERSRLPMLSARSQLTRSDHPVFVFGSLMEQGRFSASNFAIDALNHPSDLTNIKSGIEVGVPLFSGFEMTSAGRLARLAESQAQGAFDGASQSLRYETASLYIQILVQRDLLAMLTERLAASDREVTDARNLMEKGVVLGSDYYAAEAIRGGLRSLRVQIETEQAAARARLSILTGGTDWQPEETFKDGFPAIASLAEIERAALERHPQVRISLSAEAAAEESRRQTGRSLFPKVNAFAALETNTNDFGANPSNHTFGVAARLPFGDPAYFSRRSRAAAAHEVAEDQRKATEDSIRANLAQAYAAYQGAIAAVPLAKETFERASRSLDLFRPLYRSGRQSILDVMRAEEALARTHAAYLQARSRVYLTYLDVKAAAGQMDPTAVTEMARHLESKP